jgi:Mg2+-importing ATPase
MVLKQGVVEGRKTYANTIKYIKMTASSNFGNMFSILVASAFLPFLPLLPLQILLLNLIYDISCTSIPWDNVDEEYLKKPKRWDARSVGKFMLWIGPTSSIFDITTYILMFFLICPLVVGAHYHELKPEMIPLFIAVFQTGWFIESLLTQTAVIHMLRTPKIPFIQSRASWKVIGLTTFGVVFGALFCFTPVGKDFGFAHLPWIYFPFLAATLVGYMIIVTIAKRMFIRKYGELL